MSANPRAGNESNEKRNIACGRTVVLLRNAREWSGQKLAEDAGIDIMRLRRIEKGLEPVRMEELNKISKLFGIDVTTFFSIAGVVAEKWRMNIVS